MEDIGKTLKQRRTNLGVSIHFVSFATKVRSNVIEDIEDNKATDISKPYLAAFKKTLMSFYEKCKIDADFLSNAKNEYEQ